MTIGPHERRPVRLSRRRALLGIGSVAAVTLQPTAAVAATVRRVRALCRSAWGARQRTGPHRRHQISRITVHHSAVALWDNRQAPARFRAHQRAHQRRGWPDIAYHLLIDRHGHVYRGRPIWARGNTATNYDPAGHLLVMCEGDFNRQAPTTRQVTALVDVLAWACVRYDVPVWKIRGHRHYASTSCPGHHLQRVIASGALHQKVRRRLRRRRVQLRTVCGDAGRALVARIVSGAA
jgi:hypothetical protein